jgi:hypothetical protein
VYISYVILLDHARCIYPINVKPIGLDDMFFIKSSRLMSNRNLCEKYLSRSLDKNKVDIGILMIYLATVKI